jgi:hypothetical protein
LEISNGQKVVEELDTVTKDSEEKALEIFDSLDTLGGSFDDIEKGIAKLEATLNINIDILENMEKKFPETTLFKIAISKNRDTLKSVVEFKETIANSHDEILYITDTMQYQDIHRQKIERVVNLMRTLANYMNHLFSGKVEDSKRVSSARHIEGDSTSDLLSDEDLEKLLEDFGSK